MKNNLLNHKELIEKEGYTLTRPRRIILEVLVQAKKHLDAKEIYDEVRKNNIGIATVYRNLALFHSLGIIQEIMIKGKSYYEINKHSKKDLHIHFKCTRCHSIIDIDYNNLNCQCHNLNDSVESNYNMVVFDSSIMLIGLCDKCRRDKQCQDPQSIEK